MDSDQIANRNKQHPPRESRPQKNGKKEEITENSTVTIEEKGKTKQYTPSEGKSNKKSIL